MAIKKEKIPVIKYDCINCSKSLPEGKFFTSNNDFHKTNGGRFPVCKDCVKEKVDINNLNTVHDILMQLNRPFLLDQWEKNRENTERLNRDVFGTYVKNIIFNFKYSTYKDSTKENSKVKNDVTYPDAKSFVFDITREMIIRWGQNYETNDYIKLEDFYHNMKTMNKIETPQEEIYLKKLAVISLKMDQELDAAHYGQVKQLGDLFSKYMADSKFRAIDKTEADKTGGIRNFSTIFSEVEKDDHIPPWEYYRKIKNIDQDIVDKTIMHIENFTLRLNKIERMIEPPEDTPLLENDEYERVDNK
jgi:hypothetical protein